MQAIEIQKLLKVINMAQNVKQSEILNILFFFNIYVF